MPHPAHLIRNGLAALALGALIAPGVEAQTTPLHVKGSIVAVSATDLTVKAADGSETQIALLPGYRVIGLTKAQLSDVTVGKFVGIGSVPGQNGGQSAAEVTIFPPSMVGTGEGSRPWDVEPQGTMTNATVESAVTAVAGNMLTMRYAGGETAIDVPVGTPIVAITPGSDADLKPGAAVSVRAQTDASGAVSTKLVIVGLGGTVPPV